MDIDRSCSAPFLREEKPSGHIMQLEKEIGPKYDEYYFLPSKIPSRLVDFHDVTVEGSKAFTGIENSLPDSFKADE